MARSAVAEWGTPIVSSPEGADTSVDSENVRLYPVAENEHDYFVEKDGVRFAGTHLLVELWGAKHLDSADVINDTLCEAARVASATILHAHMHRFEPSGGVSGVVVLAESHISIHTWPERAYAAIDVFMCGSCDPYQAVKHLRSVFEPTSVQLTEQKRGMIP